MAFKFKKTLLWGLVSLLALLAVVLLGLVLAAKSSGVRDWVLAKAQTELAASTGASLTFTSSGGDFLSGLTLKGLRLANQGRLMVEVKELSFSFNPLAILGGRLRIGELELVEPRVDWPIDLESKDGGGGSLPLAITIASIKLVNGELLPRGQWGPIESFSAINIEGRMSLDARGVRMNARSLEADMSMAGSTVPYHLRGQCLLEGDGLQATGLMVSQGKNQIRIDGTFSWADDLVLNTGIKGSLAEPKLLPFAWPLAKTPQKPVDFDLKVTGPFQDCAVEGWLGLEQDRVEVKSRLDIFGPSLELDARLKDFDPVPWGLTDLHLRADGDARLSYDAKDPAKEKASADLDLSSLKVPGYTGGALKLSAVMEGNVLTLESLAAKGGWGELRGSGKIGPPLDERAAVEAKLELKGLTCPEALAHHLPEALRAARLSGTLAASGRLDELALNLDLGPSKVMPGVEVESLKARARIAGRDWELASLETSAAWGRLSAKGQAGPQKADLDFDLALDHLEPVTKALEGLGVEVPPLGVREISARGHLGGPWSGLAVSRLEHFNARADWGELSASGSLGRKDANLDFDLTVNQMEPMAKALEGLGAAAPTLGVQQLSARGRISGPWSDLAISRLEHFNARADWGELIASGSLGRKDAALNYKLTVHDWQLLQEALADQVGLELPPMKVGALSAAGELKGAWRSPDLTVRMEAGTVSILEREITLLEVEADLKDLGPKLTGSVDLEAQEVKGGDMSWDHLVVDAFFKAGEASLDFNCSGPAMQFSGSLASTWPWRQKNPVTISKLKVTLPGQDAWQQQGSAKFTFGQADLGIKDLVMTAGEQKLSLDARTGQTGNISGRLEVRNLQLNPWLDQAKMPEKALLNVRAELDGSLASPTFTMKGEVTGLKWGRMPEMTMNFKGEYQPGLLSADGELTTDKKTLCQARATLGANISLQPMTFHQNERGLKANLKAERLPLALFRPLFPGVYGLRGFMDMELNADGPLNRPGLEGWAKIPRAAFSLESTGQRFSDVEIKASIKGRRVNLERLHLESGGDLDLTGFVELPQRGSEGRINLDLVAKQFGVSLGSVGSALTNADLKARGDFKHPEVTGSVTPTKVEAQLTGAPPESLGDVVILKPGQEPPPMSKAKEPMIFNPAKGPLAGLSLHVVVDAQKGLTISVDEGWVVLMGRILLTKKPMEPLIYSDRLNISSGVIIMQGKRFQISSGVIAFGDKDRPDPDLSGQALYQAGQTQIFVTVTGPASDPNIQLSSQPPMNQADILSTIIFGRPARSLNTGESSELSAQAVALLGQRSAQEVQTILGPEFAPDVVTVQDQADKGYAVEAGKYLSPELYLHYRKSMGPEGGHTIGLEYMIYDWLSVDSQAGTSRDSGVDVLFNFDFK